MTTVMPTFHCFDDAIEGIEQAVQQNGADWANDHLRLVHGICLAPEGPRSGELFAHAWIELDRRFVIQAGILNGEEQFYMCRRRDHYQLLRVQLTTVYTVEEAWMKNRESNHYGPWEQVYRELCNTSGEPIVYQEAEHGSSEASVDSGF